MAIQYEPFIGFSLFGIHSSKYNIIRTSDGSRYNKQLTPNFTNIVESVDGQVGEYDFGTKTDNAPHLLHCFCEGVTEFELRWLQGWLQHDKVGKLIYDEDPYKYYMVKLESPPDFSFIPFGYSGGGVLYKGSFDLDLVAHYPYALSHFDTLDDVEYDNPRLFYNSGLLYADTLPPSTFTNITSNRNIILYNGGNANSKVNVRIKGTWDSLTVRNHTTNQEFTLKKNDVLSTFEVDAKLGQCRHFELETLATNYHSGTYLEAQGTGWVDMYEQVSFANGSDVVGFPVDAILDDDLEGKFIFMEGAQHEIDSKIDDTKVKLTSNFTGTSGLYDITIVKANKISVSGVGLNISTLEFEYKYTYI